MNAVLVFYNSGFTELWTVLTVLPPSINLFTSLPKSGTLWRNTRTVDHHMSFWHGPETTLEWDLNSAVTQTGATWTKCISFTKCIPLEGQGNPHLPAKVIQLTAAGSQWKYCKSYLNVSLFCTFMYIWLCVTKYNFPLIYLKILMCFWAGIFKSKLH